MRKILRVVGVLGATVALTGIFVVVFGFVLVMTLLNGAGLASFLWALGAGTVAVIVMVVAENGRDDGTGLFDEGPTRSGGGGGVFDFFGGDDD